MTIHEVFPYLRARRASDAIAFYAKAFGAQEKFRLVEPSGRIGHAELQLGPCTLMISDEFPEYDLLALDPDGKAPMLLHLHVDDADATIAAALAAGAQLTRAIQDEFYGERSGRIRDPFGYDWLIGHTIEAVAPDEMQRRYTALLSGDQQPT
ncbi:VOC family protein [Burkholderia sp. Ac-20344]|uniref:VOC family protein n=1 Tax=Burkholderia sp. Ac-20344 TaxID=2703890 RepID=UPI00197C4D2F|nr:VOC family protein [Burkholderia sp. Ac-20344]MBN3831433.1 VOC family protein [Burkholderia sp. Ac-20344]